MRIGVQDSGYGYRLPAIRRVVSSKHRNDLIPNYSAKRSHHQGTDVILTDQRFLIAEVQRLAPVQPMDVETTISVAIAVDAEMDDA